MVNLNIRVIDNNTQQLVAGNTIVSASTVNFNALSGTAKLRQVCLYADIANTANVFVGFYRNAAGAPSASSAPYGKPLPPGIVEVVDMYDCDYITGITASASGQIVWCTLVEGSSKN